MDWLNEHKWDRNIPGPLAATDVARFQAALDAIVGVEPDGVKRWRLVWGQDCEATRIWDRYRNEWRPRYAWDMRKIWRRDEESELDVQDHTWVAIPRYFVECLVPASVRDPVAAEAGVDPDGDVRSARRLVNGLDYMELLPIGDHSELIISGWRSCCLDAGRNGGRKCFGRYRAPNERDLEYLRDGWADRMAHCDRPGTLTEADRAAIFRRIAESFAEEKRAWEARRAEIRRFAEERVLFERMNTNPGSLKGAFSLPGQ